MTRAWMERVAIGASESGADAKLCATLWGKVDRLEKLQSGERGGIRKDFAKHMAAHRFKVGQRVIFHSPRRSVGPSIVTVLRLLPIEGQDLTYRIKATEEGFERVAQERELASLQEENA
jgi:hypothetical protein